MSENNVEPLTPFEETYINIIELAIDMSLKVTDKDYKMYKELIERRKQWLLVTNAQSNLE